jgi:hypothetical protein
MLSLRRGGIVIMNTGVGGWDLLRESVHVGGRKGKEGEQGKVKFGV